MQSSQAKPTLLLVLIALTGSILATKLALAFRLELYSDEIFYWQASQFPALAYSDLPFMTALLAGLGADLGGNHAWAVRILFLVMGSSLPLLIFWLAQPVTGSRRALESAILTLCLPMAAFLGLLAVPDVPLIFWGILFIGFTERATRTNRKGFWLAAGIAAALGLSSHYRFVLYPAAATLFLLVSKSHWWVWRQPVVWLAALIATAGLYPALSFNLTNELSGLDYHLLDRHPWQFQTEGLLHPFIQAAVVTPLMYAFCWYTLWFLFRLARKGDSRAGLLLSFSACNLGVYLILAPWSDTTRTTLHWPLSGYLPLLVAMPLAARQLFASLCGHWQQSTARRAVYAIPVTGFIGSMLVLAGIGSQGFNDQLQQIVGSNVLSNKMAGWQPLTDDLRTLHQRHAIAENSLIVTDNYYTQAQIRFALPDTSTYTIDEDKTVRDGRYTQYAIWQLDTQGLLASHTGRSAVLVTEDSTLDINEKTAVMTRACQTLGSLVFIDQLSLYQGDKRFSYYYVPSLGSDKDAGQPCPLPTSVWLDSPAANATLSGTVTVSGWAVAPGYGVELVNVLLNRETTAQTERQISREDVVEIADGGSDPQAPLLGFSVELDTREFANGQYELAVETVSGTGQRELAAIRRIRIEN